ncbi:MAG: S41 family peptidase [Absicoccus sp.]|uniref:S41 family peptidase n=1 Tax=Absicoccus sp. TaxID=2718527 RepID=UPI002A75EFBE|nr:S41 family peptidase [Absicoccus sp.]MDY3036311.1 S41 family peptidase [Absicoccus sp.]
MTKKYKWILVIACVISFGAGMFLPQKATSTDEQNKFDAIYSILTKKWYYANKTKNLDQTLMEQAITGMTTLEKDPHTNYFNLKQSKQFAQTLEGSSSGLGFSYYVNGDGNIVIRSVFIDSAADQAGLQQGDIITAVNDQVCAKKGADAVVKYIKKQTKKVTVHLIRNEKNKTTKIKPTDFDASVTYRLSGHVAIIGISSFSSHTGSSFENAVERAHKQGVSSIVLDLRNNGGGYLVAAQEVASVLLPAHSVVFEEKDSQGKITKTRTNDHFKQIKMDTIIVLQNEDTASASEVVIGALKAGLGNKVTTVGTTTYGKGTEQTQVSFEDGTSMKYTVAEWLDPNGDSINNKGWKPDVEVQPLDVTKVNYKEMKKTATMKADHVYTNAKALQTYLKYLGYDVDRTDTYFSEQSAQALKQFQRDHDLDATGICDKTTWDTLLEVISQQVYANEYSEDPQYVKAVQLAQ